MATGLGHKGVVQLAVNVPAHVRSPMQNVKYPSQRKQGACGIKYLAALHDTKCRRHVLGDARHCSICMPTSLMKKISQLAQGLVLIQACKMGHISVPMRSQGSALLAEGLPHV